MIKALAAVLPSAALGACASMVGAPMAARYEGGMLVNSACMTLYTLTKMQPEAARALAMARAR
jgi:hypothetical protein